MLYGIQFESRYRVDTYRRFIANVGSTGEGIIQFWGKVVARTKKGERGAEWTPWVSKERSDEEREHDYFTVEINREVSLVEPRRKKRRR